VLIYFSITNNCKIPCKSIFKKIVEALPRKKKHLELPTKTFLLQLKEFRSLGDSWIVCKTTELNRLRELGDIYSHSLLTRTAIASLACG
jgi:hypothetical protein